MIGASLLFFGTKLMKIVLGVLGAYLGISIGQILVTWFGLHGIWSFLVVCISLIALAFFAVTLFKLFITISTGYFVSLLSYAVLMNWQWSHTLAIFIGIAMGSMVGFFLWRSNFIDIGFLFLTSIQGASALVSGLYLLTHVTRLETLQSNQYNVLLGASAWWVLLWIVTFCAGATYQFQNKKTTETVGF